VLASAPHPEAARKYVDFLLSDDGQKILARPDIRKLPVRPSAYATLEPGYFNPFDEAKRRIVNYDLAKAQRRQALSSALFDVLVTDRQAALRDLWQSIHLAERIVAERGDANAEAIVLKAREAATWLPVTAAQSEDPGLQRGFAEQAQAWAKQVDGHRMQAAKDLQSLLSRIDSPARSTDSR
jgi:hypothetical protein